MYKYTHIKHNIFRNQLWWWWPSPSLITTSMIYVYLYIYIYISLILIKQIFKAQKIGGNKN